MENSKKERTNLPSSFNLPKLNKSISSPVERFTNSKSSFSFSLCPNNCSLSFLLCLLNDKLRSFSILLSNLFLFNGCCEFFSESGLLV